MKICVQGLGYVGATTALILAGEQKNGVPLFKVFGLENKSKTGVERAKMLNRYIFPFKSADKDIGSYLKKIKKKGNLKTTTDKKVLNSVEVVIVSLGLDLKKNLTDFKSKNFLNAINDIGSNIKEDTLIVVQSTVPIGFTKRFIYPILKRCFQKRKLDYNNILLAHSYERVTPGAKFLNSIKNSSRVYSGINDISKIKCKYFLKKFINYKQFPLTELKNTDESEFSKILENSYRAVNIAFIDEWRQFSEFLNLDLERIIQAIRLRKTHANIMMPGLGVGGYCLTKDPLFAELSAKKIFKKNIKFKFSSSSVLTNEQMLKSNIRKIKKIIKNKKIKKNKVLIFGLSYKADVDDLRHSPALSLAVSLKKNKQKVYFFDSFIKKDVMGIKKFKNLSKINNFDLIIFAVNHEDFKKVNFNNLKINRGTTVYDANLVLTNKQESILRKKTEYYYKVGKN